MTPINLLFVGLVLVAIALAAVFAARSSLRRQPLELAPDHPPTSAEARYPHYVTRLNAQPSEP